MAGGNGTGHLLPGSGHLDLDLLVKAQFNQFVQFVFSGLECFSSFDCVRDRPASRSRPPLGRSMFTMTALSDGSLFIFGGLRADGETLSEWHPLH